uniref:Enoyl-CoA hydratase/isomerase family protein n=1 Tax=Janibacter limosus TaxID=53458 RepID=A0AC61U4E2_9MICO|nr:enoyl-CoA hydratase/isomerase family protein [Janibacter limosus]
MIRYERDDEGIVTLTMDDPDAGANTMNETYKVAMGETIDRLEAERDDITGVVLTSAKKTFFAGGNLTDLQSVTQETAGEFFEEIEGIKSQLRRPEQLGKPVVAAINGAALGGGPEIALATHHRIAVDDPKVKLGLPEVSLGLLPGGGGVTRLVRMLGIRGGPHGLAAAGSAAQPLPRRSTRASSTSSSPPARSWSPRPSSGSVSTRTTRLRP